MHIRSRQAPRLIWWLLFGAFLSIGAFLLLEEHRAQMLGALPYVLGLAAMMFCIFGHRHAGAWGAHDEHGGDR